MHVTHFFYELIFARESAGKKATFLGVWGEDGGGGEGATRPSNILRSSPRGFSRKSTIK